MQAEDTGNWRALTMTPAHPSMARSMRVGYRPVPRPMMKVAAAFICPDNIAATAKMQSRWSARGEFKSLEAFGTMLRIGRDLLSVNEADLKQLEITFERKRDANAFAKQFPTARRLW
jgi:hypothetical protein